MIEEKKLMSLFEEKFELMKEMIIYCTVFVDEPKEEICKTLELGLKKLAESGNVDAAALYVMIMAYDNCCNCFSKTTARRLLFETNAIDKYLELICEQLEAVVDKEVYDYLYSIPVLMLCELINENSESKEN